MEAEELVNQIKRHEEKWQINKLELVLKCFNDVVESFPGTIPLQNSNLKLAITDGGWVNKIELKKKFEEEIVKVFPVAK